jgi:hypothetical protein
MSDTRTDDQRTLVLVGTHGDKGISHAAEVRTRPLLGGARRTLYVKLCSGKESPKGRPTEDGRGPGDASCSACRTALRRLAEDGDGA